MMEKLEIEIDNLVQNYCPNFLSYLRSKRGWKKTVFETCREANIESHIIDETIRIIISHNGTVNISCHCVCDVLKAIEFIESEFKWANMYQYLNQEELEIRKNFDYSEQIKCEEIPYPTTIYDPEDRMAETIIIGSFAILIGARILSYLF